MPKMKTRRSAAKHRQPYHDDGDSGSTCRFFRLRQKLRCRSAGPGIIACRIGPLWPHAMDVRNLAGIDMARSSALVAGLCSQNPLLQKVGKLLSC